MFTARYGLVNFVRGTDLFIIRNQIKNERGGWFFGLRRWDEEI